MGTHPLSLQEHGSKASSGWCRRCTWVPSYRHSRREFLFVHPPQVCLAQGSDQTRALAPTPAAFPIAGQVNGQRKELQYTQKQSSVTTKCGQLNKGCCLPVFIRILASNNQQDPPGGISICFGVCRIFAQTLLFHHPCLYLGADPGYSLGLARSKASAPHRQKPCPLLPQGPAQQVGGSEHFSLHKEDLGRKQSQTPHAQTKIQSPTTHLPCFLA